MLQKNDLPAIISMLADDKLGAAREKFQEPLPHSYYDAFEQINSDKNQELIVVEDAEKQVIGTLQLTFIPSLSNQGSTRAQIEAVRVRADRRGAGIGHKLFEWTFHRARERGAHTVQLTSDKRRAEAIKFYENLGFIASHEGMKRHL
ncbi:GNAT family N-acetyltransferase [Chitinophaga sp. MD30]|uniref:GNAT family N-acetyltransferase n=1 Tax=Chitinophaga sp. MD30 TaxID=2033437 RepID=UPI001E620ED5|nr:GNAT family N-acetyltransferase [Chitinophaga sp. MD30]